MEHEKKDGGGRWSDASSRTEKKPPHKRGKPSASALLFSPIERAGKAPLLPECGDGSAGAGIGRGRGGREEEKIIRSPLTNQKTYPTRNQKGERGDGNRTELRAQPARRLGHDVAFAQTLEGGCSCDRGAWLRQPRGGGESPGEREKKKK